MGNEDGEGSMTGFGCVLTTSALRRDAKEATEKYITQAYGKRCKVMTFDCPCCEMWMMFDRLFGDVDDLVEYRWYKKTKVKKARK